jgi:hypothetical protein
MEERSASMFKVEALLAASLVYESILKMEQNVPPKHR